MNNYNMIKHKYILVVEDDFDLLWLIQKILRMNGFDVLTAVTSDQAITTFSRNIWDIQAVILDLSLPGRGGKYLCKEFMKAAPQVPIIITTGFEDRAQRNELERLGVKGYLIKPFDIMNLVEYLAQVV